MGPPPTGELGKKCLAKTPLSLEYIKFCVEKRVNFSFKYDKVETIMHYLVEHAPPECVAAAFETSFRVPLQKEDDLNRTVLHRVCERMDEGEAATLLCLLIAKDVLDRNPSASISSTLAVIQAATDAGPAPELEECQLDWEQVEKARGDFISYAAHNGLLQSFWPILLTLPRFHSVIFEGGMRVEPVRLTTPLLWSFDWNWIQSCSLQWEFEVNKSVMCSESRTTAALMRLSMQRRPEVQLVTKCVKEMANVCFMIPDESQTIMHSFLAHGHVECFEKCLGSDLTIDFTICDVGGCTVLHKLCEVESPMTVKALLELLMKRSEDKGDSVNWEIKDRMGRDFLSYAAANGLLATVWPVVKDAPFFSKSKKRALILRAIVWRYDWEQLSAKDQQHFVQRVPSYVEGDSRKKWIMCEESEATAALMRLVLGNRHLGMEAIDAAVRRGGMLSFVIGSQKESILHHLLTRSTPSCVKAALTAAAESKQVINWTVVDRNIRSPLFRLLERCRTIEEEPASICLLLQEYVLQRGHTKLDERSWAQRDRLGLDFLSFAASLGMLSDVWEVVRNVDYFRGCPLPLPIYAKVFHEDFDLLQQREAMRLANASNHPAASPPLDIYRCFRFTKGVWGSRVSSSELVELCNRWVTNRDAAQEASALGASREAIHHALHPQLMELRRFIRDYADPMSTWPGTEMTILKRFVYFGEVEPIRACLTTPCALDFEDCVLYPCQYLDESVAAEVLQMIVDRLTTHPMDDISWFSDDAVMYHEDGVARRWVCDFVNCAAMNGMLSTLWPVARPLLLSYIGPLDTILVQSTVWEHDWEALENVHPLVRVSSDGSKEPHVYRYSKETTWLMRTICMNNPQPRDNIPDMVAYYLKRGGNINFRYQEIVFFGSLIFYGTPPRKTRGGSLLHQLLYEERFYLVQLCFEFAEKINFMVVDSTGCSVLHLMCHYPHNLPELLKWVVWRQIALPPSYDDLGSISSSDSRVAVPTEDTLSWDQVHQRFHLDFLSWAAQLGCLSIVWPIVAVLPYFRFYTHRSKRTDRRVRLLRINAMVSWQDWSSLQEHIFEAKENFFVWEGSERKKLHKEAVGQYLDMHLRNMLPFCFSRGMSSSSERTLELQRLCHDTAGHLDVLKVRPLLAGFADIGVICCRTGVPFLHRCLRDEPMPCVKACFDALRSSCVSINASRVFTEALWVACERPNRLEIKDIMECFVEWMARLEENIDWEEGPSAAGDFLSHAASYGVLSTVWEVVKTLVMAKHTTIHLRTSLWKRDWEAIDDRQVLHVDSETFFAETYKTALLMRLSRVRLPDKGLVKWCVADNANVSFQLPHGKGSILHEFLSNGQIDCFLLCMETKQEINVDVFDENGLSVLHKLCEVEEPREVRRALEAFVRKLKASGQKINRKSKDSIGRDALSYAAANGLLSTVWPIIKEVFVSLPRPIPINAIPWEFDWSHLPRNEFEVSPTMSPRGLTAEGESVELYTQRAAAAKLLRWFKKRCRDPWRLKGYIEGCEHGEITSSSPLNLLFPASCSLMPPVAVSLAGTGGARSLSSSVMISPKLLEEPEDGSDHRAVFCGTPLHLLLGRECPFCLQTCCASSLPLDFTVRSRIWTSPKCLDDVPPPPSTPTNGPCEAAASCDSEEDLFGLSALHAICMVKKVDSGEALLHCAVSRWEQGGGKRDAMDFHQNAHVTLQRRRDIGGGSSVGAPEPSRLGSTFRPPNANHHRSEALKEDLVVDFFSLAALEERLSIYWPVVSRLPFFSQLSKRIVLVGGIFQWDWKALREWSQRSRCRVQFKHPKRFLDEDRFDMADDEE